MLNISIITCCDKFGGISKNKQIPWLEEDYTKDDLNNFKKITAGNICVMGRNTYNEILKFRKTKTEDIIEHILPDRISYVVTSTPDQYKDLEGVRVVSNIRQAYDTHFDEMLLKTKKLFVIGGPRLYTEALAFASEIHITVLDQDFGCDAFFPVARVDQRMIITDGSIINEHMKYAKYTRR